MDGSHGRHHFLEGKSIVVAGGGIAGSAFVASLRKLWDPSLKPPTITIYDRDAQDVALQREGYSVSVAGYDTTGGLVALDKMGVMDQIVDCAVSGLDESAAFKIWSRSWKVRFSLRRKPLAGLPSGSIRITRHDLRHTLHDVVDSWDAASIQWETKCMSAKTLPDGRVRVQLSRGEQGELQEQDCDLLIAADGASSKIRSWFRPNDTLCYTGAVLRGGVAKFDGPLPTPPGKDWGFIMSNTGVSCFLSPVDDHSLLWALGNLESKQLPPLDHSSSEQVEAVLDRSLELGSRFEEPFATIVKKTDPKSVLSLNARDKLPFRHSNMDETPVVFIGDSNHAVTPFAGYGANLALCDGWDLAEQLCQSASLVQAIERYDDISEPRASSVVRGSRRRARTGHATGFRYLLFWIVLFVRRFMGWLMGKRSGMS